MVMVIIILIVLLFLERSVIVDEYDFIVVGVGFVGCVLVN